MPSSLNQSFQQSWVWLALSDEALLKLCQKTNYQGSGPGGQKRNRVYSGVRLLFDPAALESTACEFRESSRNQKAALAKLRLNIALAGYSQGELLEAEMPGLLTDFKAMLETAGFRFRAKVNAEHRDLPVFAFVALLLLRLHGGRPGDAGQDLGVSSSALVRFLKINKQVWAGAQATRSLFGLGALS